MSIDAASSTTLPRDEQPGGGRHRAAQSQRCRRGPRAADRDRPSIGRSRRHARARSRRRRSAPIISGPCSAAADAATAGTLHPSRARPAAAPTTRPTKASASSGARCSGRKSPRVGIKTATLGQDAPSLPQSKSTAALLASKRRADATQNVQPKCSLATPVILSGVHGGSQTSRTSTCAYPPARSPR